MALAAVEIDDKYTLDQGRIYLNGIQALVRLPMLQRQQDVAAGLNTACFISGYRGSPLGGYDKALWQAKRFIEPHHIHFQPGVNEDLAATAVWGTQQTGLFQGAKYDGVFSIWYGKGPGVDRSGDVFKHANMAGTARHGGVLALAGDDHACKSSTLPHQSEHMFAGCMMPVLHPANVQEVLDYGLYGWAMSRYSGLWIGFKIVADTADSSAAVDLDPARLIWSEPADFEMPAGGLNIHWPDPPMAQEQRLHEHKAYAALAFHRANRLDRVMIDTEKPRFGIITTGKAYLDVRQALLDLGIDDRLAGEIGLRVYKVAMPWPLEPQGVRSFARGLDEVLVVEEKRALIENQLKEQLYNWDSAVRPRVVGKFDEDRQWLMSSLGELTPTHVAKVIAKRLKAFYWSEAIAHRLQILERTEKSLTGHDPKVVRLPYFCSGCPHNTSTKVPDGSRALAGIGCHYMVQWMDRNTDTFTQMGGEGATWVGQAPFSETSHVFVNIGDGTYYHSGVLAIRQAVAANVNVTYKLLFNDAVAMTGGQPVDGQLTVPDVTRQLAGEGVKIIKVVSDEPEKYPNPSTFADGVSVHHRDELDEIQRELRETEGVTAIVYDQTCATEKRRRRKRGTMADPDLRVVINEAVCEGCGDCSVQSNCLSVEPIETEFGRKRKINQSSCNKDFSCLKGFCPSFVTIEGGKLRKPKTVAEGSTNFETIAKPAQAASADPYNIMITGVGGTGIVTIAELLGMAAHLENKGVSTLNQTGLAQKYGAVTAHIRICEDPSKLYATRIADGTAQLLLGCDLVVSAGAEALSKVDPGAGEAVINAHETPTAAFARNPDHQVPGPALQAAIRNVLDPARCHFVDAMTIGLKLTGDAISANIFLLGYALQKGLLPVGLEAVERAIELNGVAVDFNKRALTWGRRMAVKPQEVLSLIKQDQRTETVPARTLEEIVDRRVTFLTDYQNKRYAERYRRRVDQVAKAEAELTPGMTGLAEAVARYLFKLMAYKDEYEVARLYADGTFLARINNQFEGDFKLRFHLAPPVLAKHDKRTGEAKKQTFGPWMLRAFGLLARFKALRGTALDPFGRTEERRTERQLIQDYEKLIDEILAELRADNHDLACELAALPEHIRGYGHVKSRHLAEVRTRWQALLEAYRQRAPAQLAAE